MIEQLKQAEVEYPRPPAPSLVLVLPSVFRRAQASTEAPPPIWREHMPSKKAVVTQRDIGNFQHFWLVNEEKKLLMVAIPKVCVVFLLRDRCGGAGVVG